MRNNSGVRPEVAEKHVGVVHARDLLEGDDDESDPTAGSSGDGNKDEVIMNDPQEAAPVKVARDPGEPTLQEIEEHNVSHIPFRS